jgi:nucleotide-binding universal stress UspA family protein
MVAAEAARAEVSYGAVLVPLDGSELAERALRAAAWLAPRFAAELHVVTAGLCGSEVDWYDSYIGALRERAPVAGWHVSSSSDVADVIVSTADALERSLVCMATHGRSRMAPIVGSAFSGVLARQSAPLVAVGPAALTFCDGADDRLVVCLDGGHAAEQALSLAAAWSRRLCLGVELVTAFEPVLSHQPELQGDPESYLEVVAERAVFEGLAVDTRVLRDFDYPSLCVDEYLQRQPPKLVVASSHARVGLARAALGSVVARIIHRSPVPVLVRPLQA